MLKIPKLRWVIASMLFLATMINYLDRTALAVVSVEVRHEFRLTEQDYSHVITLFLLAYAIMYAGSGYVVDRLGTRLGFAVFISTWSIAQMLHAFAGGKWSLGAFRFLLGLAEPGTGQPRQRRSPSGFLPANEPWASEFLMQALPLVRQSRRRWSPG